MPLLDSYFYPALLLSLLGIALFIYGKRAPSLSAGLGGVALLIEPCLLFNPHLLWGVGLLTLAGTVGLILLAQRRVTGPKAA